MKATWDIFCSVVDNYGDIGVTWRLARQLVAEHGQAVRLWVDDLRAFARLCPDADPRADRQWQRGVEVRAWHPDWRPVEPAEVVIEAFACQLPEAYVQALVGRQGRLWLNLEYLSAEDWVTGCHGLPSPQPDGLAKYFFFPGFDAATGGLPRERGLLERRDAFRADRQAQQAFLLALGVQRRPEALLISLFSYENPGLGSWLDALATSAETTQLLVPEGRILGDLEAWLGIAGLRAGDCQRRGALSIHVLPFVEQDDYDRLLWCCDFNLVRGEDSFLRGQWAGRPLLWHIYQQEEGAHWAKLEAFLDLYLADIEPAAAIALRGLWRAWNAGEALAEPWLAVRANWSELCAHAERWARELAGQEDLAAKLVQFCATRL